MGSSEARCLRRGQIDRAPYPLANRPSTGTRGAINLAPTASSYYQFTLLMMIIAPFKIVE